MKKLLKIGLPILAAVLLLVFLGSCVGNCAFGCDMERDIANAGELVPAKDTAAVYYSILHGDRYSKLNSLFDKMERDKNEPLEVKRLLCIEGSKCYCAAVKKDDSGAYKLALVSADVDGKNYEIIAEYKLDSYPFYDSFGESVGYYHDGDGFDFKNLIAYYYEGKIVIHAGDTVAEYDIADGTLSEKEERGYAFPEIKARLLFEKERDDEAIRVESAEEEYVITLSELLEKSSELRYLYELTQKHGFDMDKEHYSFLYSIVYYNAEPYIVARPINRWGISFGALFKYDPETRTLTYIDCVNTNDYPDCVYPIFVDYD